MSAKKYDVLFVCLNDKNYLAWEVKDAQVMTWTLGSIDPIIVLNLRPYQTATTMWAYLKRVYSQNNSNLMHRDLVPSLDAFGYMPLIYYVKNNVFLHSLSLKNKNHPLFL
ncbi:hypothetical protein CR513_19387, partial [Mucuna pruriens]